MKTTRDQSEGLQALASGLRAILSRRACIYLKKAYSSRLGIRVAVTTTWSREESQRSPLSPGPQDHLGHGVNVSLSAEGAFCRSSSQPALPRPGAMPRLYPVTYLPLHTLREGVTVLTVPREGTPRVHVTLPWTGHSIFLSVGERRK